MAKSYTYIVTGRWPFPLDMLRRDGSQAATPEEQEKIDRYSEISSPDPTDTNDVEIALVGPNPPLTARWESFGWKVPGDYAHALGKEAKSRQKEEEAIWQGALEKLTDREREVVIARTRATI